MTIFDVPLNAVQPLQVVWLLLVCVLWIGFFFLEGFDFGAMMLAPFLSKTDQGRRVVLNTIGPHWDGNEVWLLTAGGAMFAAFPGWYATLFSGLYLPLFLVLLGLIVRGIAIEYRSKHESATWRTTWDWAGAIGSFVPALVLGVGFANFVKGLVVEPQTTAFGHTITLFAGTFWGLFHPFCLIGGLLFVGLFLTHGAYFVALKTAGEIKQRAQKYGSTLGLITIVLALAFVIWANAAYFDLPGQLGGLKVVAWIAGILVVVALAFAWLMNSMNRDGWAFLGSALATVMLVAMCFAHFYPGLGFDNRAALDAPLDITTAASSQLTLTIMTWAAGILVPIVLLYLIWSYFFVFRRRLSLANIPLDVTAAA
jgi:cytochrome d ubiquinol oxidase subunit II